MTRKNAGEVRHLRRVLRRRSTREEEQRISSKKDVGSNGRLILRPKSARLLWKLEGECCARSHPQPCVFIISRSQRALAHGDESQVLIRELETGVVSVTEIGAKDGQMKIRFG